MNKVVLIRIGEIFLKGNNRGFFEKKLFDNLKRKFANFVIDIKRIQSRYILENFDENLLPQIENILQKTFGIQSYSVANCVETTLENLQNAACEVVQPGEFKVETNRADKNFPMHSMEISRQVGGYVLHKCANVKVNVVSPKQIINIDIRENGHSYIYSNVVACERGMPYCTSGRAISMLSGGIDSPVSSYLMAKRGMEIIFLHFHSFPYTSDMAKEKVITLAKKVASYCGKMRIYFVSATKFQEEIAKICHESYLVTLLRRFMMLVANEICQIEDAKAIVTGESLAQVASQTVEGLQCSNDVAKYPVLRPLIGTDKQDIVEIAQKIDTFETSILPYEDCCTVFLPKNPATKPKISNVVKEERKIDLEAFVKEALETKEIMTIEP